MTDTHDHEGPLADRPFFTDRVWQMNYGERAAIEGILQVVGPRLAVEIGTAEGGSLRTIARYADEVHSLDLVAPSLPDVVRDGIHLHPGDSHVELPRLLRELTDQGRNVDFVLVDGDHSDTGVQRDVEDLLDSPAVAETVIITHDTANELVRSGLDRVDFAAHPKVAHVDLDFVPGHLGRDQFPGELWGGLGLIVVSASRPAYFAPSPVQTLRRHHGELLAVARDVTVGRPADGTGPPEHELQRIARLHDDLGRHDRRIQELEQRLADRDREILDHLRRTAALSDEATAERRRAEGLEAQVAHHRDLWRALLASPSWRVTAPLRLVKRVARGGR